MFHMPSFINTVSTASADAALQSESGLLRFQAAVRALSRSQCGSFPENMPFPGGSAVALAVYEAPPEQPGGYPPGRRYPARGQKKAGLFVDQKARFFPVA